MLENPQTERVATTENPFTPPTEGQASVGMQENDPSQAYDFTYVPTIARIALYRPARWPCSVLVPTPVRVPLPIQ